ncbi:MAG: L,D-transpeptidase family protein [candidate division WS1 bacterium]|nr:L,D-transpeptidase family protein [candidate division WS1 bacterium]
MVAVKADGARSWFVEALQVALAVAGVWFVLAAADVAIYERLTDGGSTIPSTPLAMVSSGPLAERVRAGRLEEAVSAAPVVDDVEGTGELAAALARVRTSFGSLSGGVRDEGVFLADVEGLANLVGAELHHSSPGAPARLISPAGIVEITPWTRVARLNFRPVELPEPPRVMDERLYVPVRGLEKLLPVKASWDESARAWSLTSGERRMQVAVPEDLFEIEISRSQRTLTVRYAGRQLVQWLCCTGAGGNTPCGTFHIQNKAHWPAWRAYWGEHIPGGSPRNPLGARWLGTTARGFETGRAIGIHGTNQPSSIGRRISGGCIRLMNAHAIELHDVIPIGTRVIIHE